MNRPLVHIEIPSKDHAVTEKFYQDTFGWEHTHMSVGEMNYTSYQSGNLPGGYADVTDETPVGMVVLYIASEDLEADAALIEKNGGKILSPIIPVGDMGAFRFFADPVGNKLGLWKSA